MWDAVNLRILCYLIQFIISLPSMFLSFKFGPLLLGWSHIESPDFRIKYMTFMWAGENFRVPCFCYTPKVVISIARKTIDDSIMS